jgi:OFA family oxalate/formate antiporter-like MFS transporter
MSTARDELLDNWPLIAVAFVLVFLSFGVPNFSMPFIYGEAMEEFGWSNTQANLLATAKFLIGAVSALGMGILIDKVGGRWTVLAGSAAGGLAMAVFFYATNLPIYYLAGGLMGFSAASIVAAMKLIVARIFSANQGLAIGVVLTATSFGNVVMPLAWPRLLEFMNWREIMVMLSLGPFLVAVPAWLVFLAKDARASEIISAPSRTSSGNGLWQHFVLISRERSFWMIALGIFLVSAVDQALMQNYVSFLRFDKGMDLRTTISWSGMLLGVIAIASKVGAGWLFDRFSIRGIAFFWGMLAVSIFLGLPVAGFGTLLLFIVVRGVAHGGLIVDVPVLTKHFFGMEHIGMTMGVLSLCVNLGYAAGPPLFGWFADVYGNFSIGMAVFGVVALIGTGLLIPIKPRFWTPPRRARAGLEDDVTRPAAAAG